jgi:FG-GAP-like repeat
MSLDSSVAPRTSVPAPRPTLAHRTRNIVLGPNAIRTVSVAIFFMVWEFYGRRMDPIFMAPPSAIFAAALQLIESGALAKALIESLWPFVVGMALTIVLGIAIGIAIAQWRFVEYVCDPFINALYAIPRIALVPLIILWAGLEFTGKVTILVSIAVFPIFWRDTSGDIAVWGLQNGVVATSKGLGNVTPNFVVQGLGDFNGDGFPDILWRDTNTGVISIWFTNGQAVTSSGGVSSLPSNWNIVQVGDYNGDGMSDLLLMDTAGDVAMWLMSGTTVSQSLPVTNVGTSPTWTVQSVNNN